jgi:hypothetical protein
MVGCREHAYHVGGYEGGSQLPRKAELRLLESGNNPSNEGGLILAGRGRGGSFGTPLFQEFKNFDL